MPSWTTERITPAPHLVGPRPRAVRLVIIHSTRGGTANSALEYTATKNWFRSPNNRAPGQDWGGCASRIIGPGGEHCIVMEDDQMPRYSAGYGAIGPPLEFLVDDYAISYEFAQPDNATPFTDAQYRRGATEIARDCLKHNIPPVVVDLFDQTVRPVPAGITRHDRTANGRKLGKSDPGKMWDDARFITLLKQEIARLKGGEEEDMARTLVRMQGRVQVYEVVAGRLIHVPSWEAVAPASAADVKEYPPNNVIWTLPAEYRSIPRQLGGPADVGP
jgi:hypothetical protein